MKNVIDAYRELERSADEDRRSGDRRKPVAASEAPKLPPGVAADRRLRSLLVGKAHKPLDRRSD
jgi:hypothetical protein